MGMFDRLGRAGSGFLDAVGKLNVSQNPYDEDSPDPGPDDEEPPFEPDYYDYEQDPYGDMEPQPRRREVEEPDYADEQGHGFWDAIARTNGRQPFNASVEMGGKNDGLGVILGLLAAGGNMRASKSADRMKKAEDENKQLRSSYIKDVTKADDDYQRVLAAHRQRVAAGRRARKTAEDSKKEFDSTHITDPKSGKAYPAASEPGVRIGNPKLAAETWPEGRGGTTINMPSASGGTEMEQLADRDYREALERKRRMHYWKLANGDPTTFAMYGQAPLPPDVEQGDSELKTLRTRRDAMSVVRMLRSAKTKADLDAAANEAERTQTFNIPEVVKAAEEAEARGLR